MTAKSRRLPFLLLLAACSGRPPLSAPTATHAPAAGTGTMLRDDWHATAVVERSDSIVLTLPSGDHQLQRFSWRAIFTVDIDSGRIAIRLDSLTLTPTPAGTTETAAGAVWSGELNDVRVNGLRVDQGGDPAARLTSLAGELLPQLPTGGVRPGTTWTDSSTGKVRVDVFDAQEQRTDVWTTAAEADHGSEVLALRLREHFEQLGDGSQNGQHLTMTAQGRRTAAYSLTHDGRLLSAQIDDSVAMLLSIPATRQVVPTQQFSRMTVRYLPVRSKTD